MFQPGSLNICKITNKNLFWNKNILEKNRFRLLLIFCCQLQNQEIKTYVIAQPNYDWFFDQEKILSAVMKHSLHSPDMLIFV